MQIPEKPAFSIYGTDSLTSQIMTIFLLAACGQDTIAILMILSVITKMPYMAAETICHLKPETFCL